MFHVNLTHSEVGWIYQRIIVLLESHSKHYHKTKHGDEMEFVNVFHSTFLNMEYARLWGESHSL